MQQLTITNHSELYPEALNSLKKMLLMKCQSTYMRKSESMPWNKPDEITQSSQAVARIFCPVVYYLVLGACGIQESDV